VLLTGAKSRSVATFAGGVPIVLCLLPKPGAVVEGIPVAVLGGAGVGLLPTVSPDIYAEFPVWFQIIFYSSISAGAMTAIVLNLLLDSDAANMRVEDDGAHASYDAVRSAAADTGAR